LEQVHLELYSWVSYHLKYLHFNSKIINHFSKQYSETNFKDGIFATTFVDKINSKLKAHLCDKLRDI
jgi:hypothetical protein